MKDILKVIRTERHDFLNHLQVISGLVQLNKQDKVLEYIQKVTKEIYSLGNITRISDANIASNLLLTNYEATQRAIDLQIEVKTELDELDIDSQGLSPEFKKILDVFLKLFPRSNPIEMQGDIRILLNEEENNYLIEVICVNTKMPTKIKEEIGVIIEKLKLVRGVNAKSFDTDKKVRVYLILDKKKDK